MQYSIRSMFIAQPKHILVEMDFSQAEAWIVAYLADEKNMKRSLLYGDIHTDTARVIYGKPTGDITKEERYMGKKQNHSNNYGQGPEEATKNINKESDKPPYITVTLREAKAFRQAWLSYYTGIPAWWTTIQDELRRTRILVTPYGRVRQFFAPWGNDLFKEGYAFIPQGTVADHCNGMVCPDLGISGGIITVHDKFVRSDALRILNQSHDSMIMEMPESSLESLVPEVKALMERPLVIRGEQFTIPVDVKVGERWGELKKWQ